jgi:CheY-like chemotaxis protein
MAGPLPFQPMTQNPVAPPLILVADDDGEICEVLVLLLADEGYRTVTAADGVQALDLASQESPDLILIDLAMPRLDGAGFCQAYLSAGGTAPVVLTSAGHPTSDADRAQTWGAAAFVAKPFDIDRLLTTIATCLGT